MYFSKATAFALAAVLPAVLGSPILETRQDGVTCQTSSASPLSADVTGVINQLNGQGGSCPNENGSNSDCTTLVTHGGASIGICGGVKDDGSSTSCADVASFANQIQQACMNGDPSDPTTRAGGTYTISASTRVEVF